MSNTRTTTLIFGPFEKPLSLEHELLLSLAFAKAFGRGYTLLRSETKTQITLTAIITAPVTQPFTRSSEPVPGAVVTALVGEATAQERS